MLRLAFAILRIVLVPIGLIWLVTRLSDGEPYLAQPDMSLIVLALLINQVSLGLFALRMQQLLRISGIQLGWWGALRIHVQSMFYFFLVPMTVGLEIARFAKVRNRQPTAKSSSLLGSLLLDRLVGAGSALVVAAATLPFVHFDALPIVSYVPRMSFILGLCAAAAVAVGLLSLRPVRAWLADIATLIRGRQGEFALIFALSMAMHTLFAWGAMLFSQGVRIDASFPEFLFAVCAGMLLVVIPFSLGGFGPADAGAAAIFLAFGYSPAAAVTMGAVPYLLRLVAAVQGGIWETSESGIHVVTAMRKAIEGTQPSSEPAKSSRRV